MPMQFAWDFEDFTRHIFLWGNARGSGKLSSPLQLLWSTATVIRMKHLSILNPNEILGGVVVAWIAISRGASITVERVPKTEWP